MKNANVPAPRELEVTRSIKASLLLLRRFTQAGLSQLSPPRGIGSPELSAQSVAEVQDELTCEFPDAILALLANQDDTLDEYGMSIAKICDLTAEAKDARACSKDRICIGRHPDGLAYYCVTRKSKIAPRDPFIYDIDTLDGSENGRPLSEWLADRLETLREIQGEDFPELRDYTPTDAELDGFRPRLV